MSFSEELKEILSGIKSLLVGMKITGQYMIKPKITVNYPWETVGKEALEGFRTCIELVPAPTPQGHKCICCGMCQRNCPSNCIHLDIEQEVEVIPPKKEGEKPKKKVKRTLKGFKVDFTLCSLCGVCVESCAMKAIRFSNDPYLVATSREELVFDLLEKVRRETK